MCGIFGVIGKTNADELLEISQILKHRGPDDEGFCSIPNVKHFCGPDTVESLSFPKISGDLDGAFGYRRLSIIDLSVKSHQPMEKMVMLLCSTAKFTTLPQYGKNLKDWDTSSTPWGTLKYF